MGFLCGCGSIGAVVLLLSFLLRVAVALTNRLVGPVTTTVKETVPKSGGIAEWDWDDWDDEFEDRGPPPAPARKANPIPEPGVLKCLAIVFLTTFAGAIGYVFLRVMAEGMGLRPWRDDTILALAILDAPVVFLSLTVLLCTTLPTRFWRAAMIVFLYAFIIVGLVLAVGAFLVFLRVLIR